jgi:hypothetical protein
MKTNFYTIVFVLLVNLLYSQNIGDYRTIASGNWADCTKWQKYTASGWTAATQFPGQTSGNYSVSIEDGHTITVGTYGNGNHELKLTNDPKGKSLPDCKYIPPAPAKGTY